MDDELSKSKSRSKGTHSRDPTVTNTKGLSRPNADSNPLGDNNKEKITSFKMENLSATELKTHNQTSNQNVVVAPTQQADMFAPPNKQNILIKNQTAYQLSGVEPKVLRSTEQLDIDHSRQYKSNFVLPRIYENQLISTEEELQRQVDKARAQLEGRLGEYNNEEDGITCARFPHLKFYGVSPDDLVSPTEIVSNIFIGPLEATLNTKELLRLGITHI